MGVTRDVEVSEVELPDEAVGGAECGKVSHLIGESKTDLDQVEAVDVGFKHSVVRGWFSVAKRGVTGVGAHNHTGELGVHRYKRERVYDGSD